MIPGWGAFGWVAAVVLGVSAGPAVLVGAVGAMCGAAVGLLTAYAHWAGRVMNLPAAIDLFR